MSLCSVNLISKNFTVYDAGESISYQPRLMYGVGPVNPEVVKGQQSSDRNDCLKSVKDYFRRMEEKEADQKQWISFYVEIRGYKVVHSVRLSSDFVNEMCSIFHTSIFNGNGSKLQLRLQGTFQIESSHPSWYSRVMRALHFKFEKRFDLRETLEVFKIVGDEALNDVLDDSIWCHLIRSYQYVPSKKNIQSVITVSVDWFEDSKICFEVSNHSSKIDLLFRHEPSKDFTLVAGNGAEMKCHKYILMIQSDLMTKMLSSDKEYELELKSGKLEMKEMSGEGLKQFVRLLYGQRIFMEMKCEMVLELFKYSHLYRMMELRQKLTTLLLQRVYAWYTPDVLVELYVLLNRGPRAGLRESLRKYLLCCMSMKKNEIRKCKKYRELGRKDCEDLLWSLISI